MYRFKSMIVYLAVLMTVGGFCRAGNETNEAINIAARRANFEKIFDHIQPVHIYGKVMDTEGNVIGGAEVRIGCESALFLVGEKNSGTTSWVKSDDKGCWSFTIAKPYRAFVEEVKKAGYEYSTRFNSTSISRNLVDQTTTRDAPVLSILRKKSEPTFLMRREGNQLIRVVSPQSQTNSLDVISEQGDKAVVGGYSDLQIMVNYGNTGSAWTITCLATNETDGIIMATNLLYEAPQEGYQKKVVLKSQPWPHFLYLRSRNPAIYTRLDLEYSMWKETDTNQGFRISYKAWVNPYGERNLEYETDLEKDWRLSDQLNDEGKNAHRQSKRPVKHDLQKLIREAKDKTDKNNSRP